MTAPLEQKKKPARKRREKTARVSRGKRKESKARAVILKGTGRVLYNGAELSTVTDPTVRMLVLEPLDYYPARDSIDIKVSANGGGKMSQAQAARTAIAKAVAAYSGDDGQTRRAMIGADRSLIVEDPRRVEPKKFKGPKARARFTKSYR